MSGFLVSNNFGCFNSETTTKKFAAVGTVGSGSPRFVDIPNAPTTGSFEDLLQGNPHVTGLRYTNEWAFNDWSGIIAVDDGSTVDFSNPGEVRDLFENYGGSYNTGDKILLYEDDAFHYKAHPKTTAKFRVRYITNDKNTQRAYNYVVNIKKNGSHDGQSVPTACNSSSVPCFTSYVRQDGSGVAEFHVYLDGSTGSYMSIDMNKNSGDIANSKFVTSCGTWQRIDAGGSDDPANKDIDRVEIQLREIKMNPVEGCTDEDAYNYDSNATVDQGCTYENMATISSFTATPSEVTVGDDVTLAWNLSNGNFTKVEVLHNGSDVNTKGNAKNTSMPTPTTSLGSNSYQLKVTWDKPNTIPKTSTKSVTAVAATSYIQCTDPNRAKDSNGECADCNSGYHLGSDGLCTQCADPNRDMDSDGNCTDCMSGYALGDDGLCQKAGCMDEDDYNYDPEAVIADDSLCEGSDPDAVDCEVSDWSDWSAWSEPDTESGTRTRTRTIVTAASGDGASCPSLEETETGVLNPDTGEVTITTMGGDTPVIGLLKEDTEKKSPILPIVIGVGALGVLAMLMRR